MNAARLTPPLAGSRRRSGAHGRGFLVDEINDSATGWSLATSCAELAQIREEIASLRGELRSEITAVRSEITALSGELRSEITAARGDMRSEIASVRGEIAAVRGDIWRVVLTVFGAQVVLIGSWSRSCFQILR